MKKRKNVIITPEQSEISRSKEIRDRIKKKAIKLGESTVSLFSHEYDEKFDTNESKSEKLEDNDILKKFKDKEEKLLKLANKLFTENNIDHPGCLIYKLKDMNFYNHEHLNHLQALLIKVVPFGGNDFTLFDDCFVIENNNHINILLGASRPVSDYHILYFQRYDTKKKQCVTNRKLRSCDNIDDFSANDETLSLENLDHILSMKRGNPDNLLHELLIAKLYLNKLRKYIPNFLFIYSLSKAHDKIYLSNNIPESIDNSDQNILSYEKTHSKIPFKATDKHLAELIHEKITNSSEEATRKSLYTLESFEIGKYEYPKKQKVTFDDIKWLSYYLQVILALYTANLSGNTFVHLNLNSKNIILLKNIENVIEYGTNKPIYVLTDAIAVITNFKYSYLKTKNVELKTEFHFYETRRDKGLSEVFTYVNPYRDIIHLTLCSIINIVINKRLISESLRTLLDFFVGELFFGFNELELLDLYNDIKHVKHEKRIFMLARWFKYPMTVSQYLDKLLDFISNSKSYSSILKNRNQFDKSLYELANKKKISFRFTDNYFLAIKSVSGIYKFGIQNQRVRSLFDKNNNEIALDKVLYNEIRKRWRLFSNFIKQKINTDISSAEFSKWEILTREKDFIEIYDSISNFCLAIIYWNDFTKDISYLMNIGLLSKERLSGIIKEEGRLSIKDEIIEFINDLIEVSNYIKRQSVKLMDFDDGFNMMRSKIKSDVIAKKSLRNVDYIPIIGKSERLMDDVTNLYKEKIKRSNTQVITTKQQTSLNTLKNVISKYSLGYEFITKTRNIYFKYVSITTMLIKMKDRL